MECPMMAITKIRRNPNQLMEHNGKYDDFGDPIMRSAGQVIVPGTMFLIDDTAEDFQWLLDHEAMRELEPAEKLLWKQMQSVDQDIVR